LHKKKRNQMNDCVFAILKNDSFKGSPDK